MDDKENGPPKFGVGGKINDLPPEKREFREEPSEPITETFEEPVIPDLAFNHRWTVWEQIESKNHKDYASTMEKVAWFGDAITFWKVWNKIPHSTPKNFFSFSRDGKSYCNYYTIRGREEKISTLALFKTGIIPAWEDAANKNGGEYTGKVETDKDKTHIFWNALVKDLVSDNFPATDRVCGVRVLDKGRLIKIELWVDYGLRKYCEQSAEQHSRLKEI